MKFKKLLTRKGVYAALIVLTCVVLLLKCGGAIVKPIIEKNISESIAAEIDIDSVDLPFGFSVKLNDVTISSAGEKLFHAEHIDLQLTAKSLLSLRPVVKSAVIEGFQLHASCDSDTSQWNFRELEFIKQTGKSTTIPMVRLNKGTLKVTTCSDPDDAILVGINGHLTPTASNEKIYGFDLRASKGSDFEGSEFRGTWHFDGRGTVKLNSGILLMGKRNILGNSWDVNDIKFELEYDSDKITISQLNCRIGEKTKLAVSGSIADYKHRPAYDLNLTIEDGILSETPGPNAIVYSKQVRRFLSPPLVKFLETYHPQGLGDLELKCTGKLNDLSENKWHGIARCKDISVLYDNFTYLLEHMKGEVKIAGDMASIDRLECNHGIVELVISGFYKKTPQGPEYDMRITSDNLVFDRSLCNALGEKQKKIWFSFTPSGRARINQRLTLVPGNKKQSRLEMNLVDTQATYEHFPYQLDNLTGRVVVTNDSVELTNVAAHYADRKRQVTLNGEITGTRTDKPLFNIVIDAKSIPIDSMLMAALTQKQRKFYQHFEVNALTDAVIKVFPNDSGIPPVEYSADVSITDAAITYNRFPVPLKHVNLKAVLTADEILLKEMTGKNGDGTVEISGTAWPSNDPDKKSGLCLEINAKNLQLDQSWLEKTEGDWAKMLSQFQPGGAINATANINIDAKGDKCGQTKVVIDFLGNNILHKVYAYPIEGITGQVISTEDKIEFKNLSGIGSGKGKIGLNGMLLCPDGKIKSGEFSFTGSQVPLDESLSNALSDELRNLYVNLGAGGALDFDFDKLTFAKTKDDKNRFNVKGKVTSKNASIGDAFGITDIDGELLLDAQYEIGKGLQKTGGSYNARSFLVKKRKVSDLRGEIIYDNERSTLTSSEFMAKIRDGRLLGNARIELADIKKPRYNLELLFDNIDMADIVIAPSDGENSASTTTGKINGELNIAGSASKNLKRNGRLNLRVNNMKLAKRSFMGKVLAAMQLTSPTDYMFSNMKLESYLENDTLNFSNISMSGKSVVFKGTGDLNLVSNEIDLDFSAYGTSLNSNPSLFESLARSLGSAMVKVEVDGNTDEPQVKVTALPLLKGTMGILGDKEK